MQQIFRQDHHSIRPSDVGINALKVVNRLTSSGYRAFLVGGSVRDLLLGAHPKDFDVATDAHPDEVKQLFRNSRLIGRRFRIVHVRFGREIIEVATFRAHHDRDSHQTNHSKSGLILDDNVYGSLDEDMQRRDFTINALYYQADEGAVYDQVGGMADLQSKTIRLIGDPETRYREDPVRMLRAIRFAAKLNFSITPETIDPVKRLGVLLHDISPARLFEEVLKLLMMGNAEKTFVLLREHGLIEWLFPDTQRCLDSRSEALIMAALQSTDQRIREDRPVTPAFLYAALLWSPVSRQSRSLQDRGLPPVASLHEASGKVINKQVLFTSIPRRISVPMKEIWELQLRLPRRGGQQALNLLSHKRFRAAYDFLLLREIAGEDLNYLGNWWTEFQEQDDKGRKNMVARLQPAKRRRKRRKRSAQSKPSAPP
ncbi:MAG: polynucleotide adenylyltransferase PcnB [Pseudomonadales bacterium]|jgi:poly(A) polymerase|nr:polynucleotide adenylyltransferase PcnB [Pseudomonadales bacterium]MDP7359566.1 polynucleotide adenylyltransferase PcnB [Pseudomonadales bacterium]MDP7595833.1 polynucleotide adenylyltransferase PcnB [Pseudomonadales bacterium]HJN49935.1 polynucleotide adenylyltransferase PcnB [Pseudomonadales bacterium]|tara:strand:+ start:457 stop:1737 length:1281 start_codon:yes stop_codon:yes gene_type:complete